MGSRLDFSIVDRLKAVLLREGSVACPQRWIAYSIRRELRPRKLTVTPSVGPDGIRYIVSDAESDAGPRP